MSKISKLDLTELKDLQGLTQKEAEEILKKDGYNELPSTKKKSIFAIFYEIATEPMFLLLVSCGILYLILGDIQEAVMLLGFVFFVMGITFYQERKTERALEALKDLSSPRALVIRDGEEKRIPGRDVVVGDIIILSEGDRIPADGALIHTNHLTVDESLLTGESVPVRKRIWDGKEKINSAGGDDIPFVFSGSLVVQGQGIAKVLRTGMNTEIGKIGKALMNVEEEETNLQRETGKLVKNLAIIGVILCCAVIIIYGITRGNWIKGLLAGLTLAMATLPEEFPVVLTIFLALGAWRMSKKNVLTRKVPAVEMLGSAKILCVDKTGTLTYNKMSVKKLYVEDEFLEIDYKKENDIPEKFHEIIEYSLLASHKNPFDPMEKAINSLGRFKLSNTEHLHDDWDLVHQYPLTGELLAMSQVWISKDENNYIIASKGAPEAILDLCHLDKKEIEFLMDKVKIMASEGYRVLGVAKSYFNKNDLPNIQHDFNFKFIGFIALADPIRETVPDAIKECYKAGIRVIMITGDYPATAKNIAEQIGLYPNDNIITGNELNEMSDDELAEKIKNVNIFARVVPEQKLRIVNALKKNGDIVAMTGDGVNDAPALKSAHIGIAMGERGTDVAREASSLVLLDDDFSSIVGAVKMGRRIFDNLKKAMSYILAIHVPIAGLSLIPVFFNKLPWILYPIHVVFLEMIIDPSCSIVFEMEEEEKNVMNRPPRDINEPLFGKKSIIISFLQGFSVLFITLCVYMISIYLNRGEEEARTLTFTTLIIANLGLIWINRSWNKTILSNLSTPNIALKWVFIGSLVFLGFALYNPYLQKLFHFNTLHGIDLIICFLAGIISIIWFEIFKYIQKEKLI